MAENINDKLKCISLTAGTVRKHTANIREGLQKQVLKQTTQCGRVAVELGRGTDVSCRSQLRGFDRFSSDMRTGRSTFCESLKGKEVWRTCNLTSAN